MTNAVIVGAEVVATHTATAQAFKSRTNEVGLYTFPSAPIGNYEITVSAAGMKTWRGEIVLQVGQTAVVDVTLAVGGTMAEVTVAGDVTPLLSLNTSTVGNVLERARIEQLPLNGRFIQNLVLATTPGLEGSGGAPRVYGLTAYSLQYVQDGVTLGNREEGGLSASSRPPGIDTVQEFRVETSTSSARYSMPASVIISTKSGTNQVHGSFFETARNNAIGLARRREETWTTPPKLIRNEFGASLGGPVYIPKVYNGKNRTFFFFGYEAFRQASGSTVGSTLPTMPMRNGDFSGLVDRSGRFIVLYDPWSTGSAPTWVRTPFPNNQIPAQRQSPAAKYLFSITPAPTDPAVNPLVANNYYAPASTMQLQNTSTVRIDQRLSPRDQIFGRYTFGHTWQRGLNYGSNPPTTTGETGLSYTIATDRTGAFSWTRSFSPTFFSEMLFAFNGEDWKINATGDATSTLLDKIGVPLPAPRPLAGQQSRDIGFGNPGTFFYWSQEGRRNTTHSFTLDENLTKVHGRHKLQFGGRWRRDVMYVEPDAPVVMSYYNSLATALYDPKSGSTYGAVPYTGHNLANFFIGVPRSYEAPMNRPPYNLTEPEYALYFNDNVRVNQRLTLNVGLRYENYPGVREAHNLLSGFDLASLSVVTGRNLQDLYKLDAVTPETIADYKKVGVTFTTPGEVGMPSGVISGDSWAFGPRAGFAYRAGLGRHPTVIRGGYALFRHRTYDRNFTWWMRTTPPLGYQRVYNVDSPATSPDLLPNYSLRSAPAVIQGVNSSGILNTDASRNITPGGCCGVYFFGPDQPAEKAHEWNLTVEREIRNDTVLRLGYVGTHGSDLNQWVGYNDAKSQYIWFVTTGQPYPSGIYSNTAIRPYKQTPYGNIYGYQKTGFSNASSFRVEVERRYSRGVGFQFFYVLTNAMRAGGDATSDGANLPIPEYFLPGAVPQDLDARNRLLNYARDTGIPKHEVRWNWIVDLPFGTGKKLAPNAGRWLDRVIGGWQLAGFGRAWSRYFALSQGNWGGLGKVEVYGDKYPIQDCRSGTCYAGYLYYNGYIQANRINSYGANGKPNGVMGVPTNYVPSSWPVFPTPADGGSPSDPNYPYYESNTVWVKLNDGSLQRTTINTNLHPWRNQYVAAPMIWSLDASLFKRVAITEQMALRFNADFFNVLNRPGNVTPDSTTGIISLRTSALAARVLQFTLRLTW